MHNRAATNLFLFGNAKQVGGFNICDRGPGAVVAGDR
jgi:hypothetical protein